MSTTEKSLPVLAASVLEDEVIGQPPCYPNENACPHCRGVGKTTYTTDYLETQITIFECRHCDGTGSRAVWAAKLLAQG